MALTKHLKLVVEPEVTKRLDALLVEPRFSELTFTRSDLVRQAIVEFLRREERKA